MNISRIKTSLRLELDPKFRSIEKMEPGSSYGVIYINDFYEHFYMSSSWWSIADYLRQWDMAYQRLQSRKDACFVVNVQPYTPLIAMWTAYVGDENLYIRNQYLFGDYYKQIVGTTSFTPENSFDFIRIRKKCTDSGDPIAEWTISLDK